MYFEEEEEGRKVVAHPTCELIPALDRGCRLTTRNMRQVLFVSSVVIYVYVYNEFNICNRKKKKYFEQIN